MSSIQTEYPVIVRNGDGDGYVVVEMVAPNCGYVCESNRGDEYIPGTYSSNWAALDMKRMDGAKIWTKISPSFGKEIKLKEDH